MNTKSLTSIRSRAEEFQKTTNHLEFCFIADSTLKMILIFWLLNILGKNLACFQLDHFPFYSYNNKKSADFEFSYDIHGKILTKRN